MEDTPEEREDEADEPALSLAEEDAPWEIERFPSELPEEVGWLRQPLSKTLKRAKKAVF